MRARLAAALCGTLLGLTSSVGAAEITWNAPDTCDRREGVSEQVERLLGQNLASVDNVDFEVTIESRTEDAWRLRLVTVERAGEERRTRELGGRSCQRGAGPHFSRACRPSQA